MSNMIVDENRLWKTLMETAKLGGLPNGGVARLTLTEHDKNVRDWLTAQCKKLGMSVKVDEVGNMFALREGRNNNLAPVAMGSHLDTQPTGGKFDGVLGVLGGLEVLRTLDQSGYVTEAPLMLVNWTNEEGSRFSPAMLGSGVYAGVYSRDYAYNRQDVEGIQFGNALADIGYRGEATKQETAFGAMFELHIEQGPILEAQEKLIGVVQGVQGMRWYEGRLSGCAAHTGSTPMSMRRNALLGLSRLISYVDDLAHQNAPHAVGTIGFVEILPNSTNVIPGEVHFTVDIRHPNDAVLNEMETYIFEMFDSQKALIGLSGSLECISRTDAVVFNTDCIEAVRYAAEKHGYSHMNLISGAGHDAAHTANIVPTTMIFVPSEGGLSHNEAEATRSSECAAGAQVLLDAVIYYDRKTAEQHNAA